MVEALIAAGAAVVTGILSLVGVMITNSRSNNKMQNEMKTVQAVNNERIDELTREVRRHNDFATRVPVLETRLDSADRRLKNLESYHKPN